MTRPAHRRFVGLFMAFLPVLAAAQESKSAPLAQQLAQLMERAKLTVVAAKDPSAPDVFVAAMYFPGIELLVVSAKYSVPTLLTEKLGQKKYDDVYADLNSASVQGSKTFVEDLGADGLHAKRENNQPYDTFEKGATSIKFDGDWKKQKLSEEDYMKAFAAADDAYAKLLTTLVDQVKKGS